MLLGVKSEIAIESRIKSMAATVKYVFDDEEIIFDELAISNGKEINFELLDKDDVVKAKALLTKELKGTVLSENGLKFNLQMTEDEVDRTQKRCYLSSS